MIQTRTDLGIRNLLTRVYRSRAGLYFPDLSVFLPKHRNVVAVLGTPSGLHLIPASNIITSAGDQYYAEKAAGQAPTNAFTTHYLATAGTPGKAAVFSSFTTVGATAKTNAVGYPKTSDADVDNTQGGVNTVTHFANYAKADFTHTVSDITHGLISIATAVAGSPLLSGYAFTVGFKKTADDTLKVFVNHAFTGI